MVLSILIAVVIVIKYNIYYTSNTRLILVLRLMHNIQLQTDFMSLHNKFRTTVKNDG